MKRKSIKEVVENPRSNEYYVLVTRYYPMELRKRKMKLADSPIDLWDRTLAPSKTLLADVKKRGLSWSEYVKRFNVELPRDFALRKLIQYECQAGREKEVVLVCIEEDSEYPRCHTWILLGHKEWFEGMSNRDQVELIEKGWKR